LESQGPMLKSECMNSETARNSNCAVHSGQTRANWWGSNWSGKEEAMSLMGHNERGARAGQRFCRCALAAVVLAFASGTLAWNVAGPDWMMIGYDSEDNRCVSTSLRHQEA
jgi:hypothetical protein